MVVGYRGMKLSQVNYHIYKSIASYPEEVEILLVA